LILSTIEEVEFAFKFTVEHRAIAITTRKQKGVSAATRNGHLEHPTEKMAVLVQQQDMQKFSKLHQHYSTAVSCAVFLHVLHSPDKNCEMIKKPRHIAGRWNCVVDNHLYSCASGRESNYLSFSIFSEFLQKEARIAGRPAVVSNSQTIVPHPPCTSE